ncbi:unnamed protein product [Phytophthora fragariaefolia]|uniref:Unnamed protein product n=1 Tax=Phytophthora fragariaefolia TaxID=1490495 RepID=A0A9W7D3F1_9STRA|nr:unnamed protein product [Phytophthora fragariaefolia]
MCVRDTEADTGAAPDSQLLNRLCGYLQRLEVAQAGRTKERLHNERNYKHAVINATPLERFKNNDKCIKLTDKPPTETTT